MKNFIICLSLCFSGLLSFGQITLQRQVIATTGNFSSSGGLQLSSTVGEPVIETFTSGSLVLTQGFQQGDDDIIGGIGDLGIVLNYTIYPNPTTDKLFITLDADKPLVLTLQLTDMTGRQTGIAIPDLKVNGATKRIIDLSQLASGQYLLHLLDAQNKEQKTFKVMKVD